MIEKSQVLQKRAEQWSKYTNITSLQLGPFVPQVLGPVMFSLELDGEWITKISCETGFTSRNVEIGIESRAWYSTLPLIDHIDAESSVFFELAYALAIEQIADLPVSPREQGIRVIFSELNRIQLHIKYLVRVAEAVGAQSAVQYLLRDRDGIIELIELLTGVRFGYGYIIPGGVKCDVTEGFLERVLEATDVLRIRIREIQEVFIFSDIFLERAKGVAKISPEMTKKYGITGPNRRASGDGFDVRLVSAYSGYELIDFNQEGLEVMTGDCLDRVFYRTYEMGQSASILRQVVEKMSHYDGFAPKNWSKDLRIPSGQGFSRVESTRGVLGCFLVSDGGSRPAKIHFSTPSRSIISGLPEIIPGTNLEDFPLAIASLDISMLEIDK